MRFGKPRGHQQHRPLSPSIPQRLPPAKDHHQDHDDHDSGHDQDDLEEGEVGVPNVVKSDL